MASDSKVFECETIEDILVVIPRRDFMSMRDSDLRDAYNEMYRQMMGSVRHLIFDFSHLDYFGSTFVGMMIRLAKKAHDDGIVPS